MNFAKLTLLALAAALPPSASAATSDEACRELMSRARPHLGDEQLLRCEPAGQTLLIIVDSEDAFLRLRDQVFPNGSFRDHEVKLKAVQKPSFPSGAKSGAAEGLEKFSPAALPTTFAVNFDNEGARGRFLQVGPPGSTPPGAEPPQQRPDSIRRSGPPGSQPPAKKQPSGPPGSTPPGSQPPGRGDDAPPQGSTPPPSKPTPVFIPRAPAPNYWNTIDWGTVPMWERLPNDWEQATFDEDQGRYVSRWYPYSRPFVRTTGSESVRKDLHRKRGVDALSAELVSRDVLEIKQCYYQGVYRLRWNSFEGEWEGTFSHYRAACKRDEQYSDTGKTARIEVRFSMRGQDLMPWETETVRLTFDGSRPGMQILNPSYRYTFLPAGMPGAYSLEAGDKILTAPDHEGVTAEVVADGKTLKLRVFDKWAGYYQGETLEVSAKLMRVNPSWNPFASNFVEGEFKFDNGSQLRFPSAMPPGGPGAGMTYDKDFAGKTCGTYYLEAWSFRRGNNNAPDNKSRLSSGDVVRRGSSRRIKLCD